MNDFYCYYSITMNTIEWEQYQIVLVSLPNRKIPYMKNKFKLSSLRLIDSLFPPLVKWKKKCLTALDSIERMLTSVLMTHSKWPQKIPTSTHHIENAVKVKSCNEKCIATFDWWYTCIEWYGCMRLSLLANSKYVFISSNQANFQSIIPREWSFAEPYLMSH